MFATFVLMLAAFVIAFAFLAFFVFAAFMLFAFTFMLFAFAFMFLATFMFVALRFWHVGFHLAPFLCPVDSVVFLSLVEVLPVGEGVDQTILACHHFRAHTWHFAVVVALMMMLVALFFLVFA